MKEERVVLDANSTAHPQNLASAARNERVLRTLPAGPPRWIWNSWLGILGVVFVGVIVFSPALRCKLLLDDYVHASMIDGTFPSRRSAFDLYNFVDERERPMMLERGMLPWWSDPNLRIRFLRPLASALRWGEQRIFGRAIALFHVHSFLWWTAAVFAARRLFRKIVPERAALLATLIFAFAPCHVLPLGWLANRETLISLTFAALAVTSYLRWREGGGIGHAAAALGLFAAAMVAGEYALCFAGYILAFEFWEWSEIAGAQRRWHQRVCGLLIYGIPAAVYLGIRAAMGYGTQGSGFYEDPFREPLPFLRAVPRRLVQLLLEEFFTLDAKTLQNWPMWAAAALTVVTGGLLGVAARRASAVADPASLRRARSMLFGSLLALLPVTAVDPSPRLLGAALLGLAPMLALVLDTAWFLKVLPARRGLAGATEVIALGIGFFQFVHGPVTAWTMGAEFQGLSTRFASNAKELRQRIQRQDSRLFVLRGSNDSFFLPFALEPDGRSPFRWSVLAATDHVLALRHDARTMELVVSPYKSMFSLDPLFRNHDNKIHAGDVFETSIMKATVLEVDPEGPRRVRFELGHPLDAGDIVWVAQVRDGAFSLASIPSVGFGQPFD